MQYVLKLKEYWIMELQKFYLTIHACRICIKKYQFLNAALDFKKQNDTCCVKTDFFFYYCYEMTVERTWQCRTVLLRLLCEQVLGHDIN